MHCNFILVVNNCFFFKIVFKKIIFLKKIATLTKVLGFYSVQFSYILRLKGYGQKCMISYNFRER